ncbi:hypothetical protein ANCCEY_06256, partial [Ancylostoma ceylanicum]
VVRLSNEEFVLCPHQPGTSGVQSPGIEKQFRFGTTSARSGYSTPGGTKDQFARDDPAFLVLLAFSLLFSSVFYAVALGLSLWGFVKFFLWLWLTRLPSFRLPLATPSGLLQLSTMCILRFLDTPKSSWEFEGPKKTSKHQIRNEQHEEKLVELNAVTENWANTPLPILHRTQYFLYPMTFLFISWVATITAGWNISQSAMGFYHYRCTYPFHMLMNFPCTVNKKLNEREKAFETRELANASLIYLQLPFPVVKSENNGEKETIEDVGQLRPASDQLLELLFCADTIDLK